MINIKSLMGALLFFLLGFVASEYHRYLSLQQNDVNTQYAAVNKVGDLNPGSAQDKNVNNSAEPLGLHENGDLNAKNNSALNPQLPHVELFSWGRVNQLIANENYDDAVRLLLGYLETNINSAQAWFLLANTYQKQGKHKSAIDAWFHYLKVEVDSKKIDQAIRQIKNYLIMLNEKPALFGNDSAWLIAQLDTLQTFSLNDGELHLMLASLYLGVDDTYQAQYHALMAANDPVAQKRAEEILAKLNGKTVTDELAIPLVRFGNQHLINVSIEGHPARLLLDTGASLSGVSKSYAAKYPSIVKAAKPFRLNTASGAEDSYFFTVDNLSVGSLVFTQHILALFPMNSSEEFDGLLGVDILGRFDFVIDQDALVLRLRERKK